LGQGGVPSKFSTQCFTNLCAAEERCRIGINQGSPPGRTKPEGEDRRRVYRPAARFHAMVTVGDFVIFQPVERGTRPDREEKGGAVIVPRRRFAAPLVVVLWGGSYFAGPFSSVAA
jgi:hypothetical protein